MDNLTENEQSDIQEQGPRKGIVIIVICILLGTNALLLWQFFEKKNNLDVANKTIVTTNAEKDALQIQLNQAKTDYEKIKSENTNLETQLASKDEEIKSKLAEIQRLISVGGPAQVARAKAELGKLRELNSVYVAQIDSLNKVNTQLQAENQSLNSNLSAEQLKTLGLTSENSRLSDKVVAGSVLKASNVVTEGLRYKSSGKEMLTLKAKSVTKLRTKFVINENRVIDKGPIDLYIRVLGPDGAVMSADQATFMSGGKPLVYTQKQTIDYNNQDVPMEVIWAKGTQFAKGKYTAEIYHNGGMIGTSSITLK